MSFTLSNFTNGLTSRLSPIATAAIIIVGAMIIVPFVKRRFC